MWVTKKNLQSMRYVSLDIEKNTKQKKVVVLVCSNEFAEKKKHFIENVRESSDGSLTPAVFD